MKLKTFLFLALLFCFCQKTNAQDFEWVYTIPSVMEENDGTRGSRIRYIVTNSSNDIYAFGSHSGIHDFGNQEYSGHQSCFIVKLDQNKNVLWVKKIPTHIGGSVTSLNGGGMLLDADENIIIIGNVITGNTGTALNFDPSGNPGNAYQNLLQWTRYGVLLKLDADGNYINSTLFENILIEDIIIDNSNNIVIAGATTIYEIPDGGVPKPVKWLRAYIAKLDSGLNITWDKTYSNNGKPNAFFSIGFDSQNNIYCQGTFLNSFSFGATTIQDSSSEFVCKLQPNGNESWVNKLATNPTIHHVESAPLIYNRKIKADAFDNIYFSSSYPEEHSYHFNNVTINNLPNSVSSAGSVFFKMDINGNHIWNIPFQGIGMPEVKAFEFNSSHELVIAVYSNYDLHYADDPVIQTYNNAHFFLLKADEQGNLIDYKRFDFGSSSYSNIDFNIDNDDNVFLAGAFAKPTDFDPHPFNEYMVYPSTYINIHGYSVYEGIGFVLKLTPCDVEPLFLNHYDFCYEDTPAPTIGDIAPNDFNINWYSSVNSQTPLADGFLIEDGATYYMEKTAENCPVLIRQPVQMTILPPLAPPILDSVQPCYFQGMTLSDLAIQGENLTFYSSLLGDLPIESSMVILTDATYYVTQTIGNCESERTTINVGNLELTTHSHVASVCDNSNDTVELVNLSDYISHYITSLNGFSVSYHISHDEALNGTNAIVNYQNFQAANDQTIYIRFNSEDFGCFEIAELIINLSLPPEIIEIKIDDLAENNAITILPYNEDYVYSINGVTYQSSNYFDHLSAGEYAVYVKDTDDSCLPATESVFLLSYPKFFTPNDDGFNDVWRIKFSQYQELLNVEIYDRYGKPIISFDKDGMGWDGTFSGKLLPATDYWFKITRMLDQKIIYRGHFSLVQ